MQKTFLEKHHDSINSSTIVKSRSERDLTNNFRNTNTKSVKFQDEEEKNYQFIYQIDENLSHKKNQNKRKIEFLEEKLKKPYNQIIEMKLLENNEVQNAANTEM